MVKVVNGEEVSIEELKAMADFDDSVRAENFSVLSDAGSYIENRINAVLHKIHELVVNHPLIDRECFVLDSNKLEILVVTLNDRGNKAILSVIDKNPELDKIEKFKAISYNDAATRFNKRKCGLSLAKALQKNTKKLQASTKKHKDELEAFRQAMDSAIAN